MSKLIILLGLTFCLQSKGQEILNKIEGTVILKFKVNTTGNLMNPEADKLVWGLTEEALRIVEEMPE